MQITTVAVAFGFMFTTTASAEPATTREDLLAAYVEDVSARARYEAYAEQAEREGFPQAARLFRATAHSEAIRAANLSEALRRIAGAPAAARVGSFSVQSTRANLTWTLAREGAERGMYRRLTDEARRAGDAEAALEFLAAQAAHDGIVKLYQEAVAHLGGMRHLRDELHVCGACGHVANGGAPHRCPISRSEGQTYALVE